jgi:hypothetical protein
MAIFNLSSTVLSPVQQTVLGLGTKFLPLPNTKPSSLLADFHDSIAILKRRLSLAFYFGYSVYTPSSIPKLDNKVLWNPPHSFSYDPILNCYINSIKQKAASYFNTSKSYFNDLDRTLLNTLTHLSKNNSITIKPADKNLGLVILDTTSYKQSCLTHLLDTSTYAVIATYNKNIVYSKLRQILVRHNLMYTSHRKLTTLATSLLQLQNHKSLRIAPFYILPKVHKSITPPIPGRPIVSSNSTATYHASVYLDRELQPVLKLLPTVCTSSRTLIHDMATFQAPLGSCILCADITSLYPNIPIDIGLSTVRSVLTSLNVFSPSHLDFLMDLLHWVLTENYCTFDNVIYHQLKGTAMGTPTAVSYSNIFLYGIESKLVAIYGNSYFTRYIDDVFGIFHSPSLAQSFVTDFNSQVHSIKFDAITIGPSGIMLDLDFSLQSNPLSPTLSVSHKIYQKERNIYQYIPTMSEHPPHLFKNFVFQELNRYRLACTTDDDFHEIASLFHTRLLARGYPSSIFLNALSLVPPRTFLMEKLRVSLSPVQPPHEIKTRSPILTLRIPRLYPFLSWPKYLKLPTYLTSTKEYKGAFNSPDLIVGTKNPRNIGSYLIRSLYKEHNAPP